MSLADIQTRESILAAIAEYDALGQAAFLAKYGFGRARLYFLAYSGREYDSKAIVGAAHGYEHLDRGPLGPYDFSGGEETVVTKLESLGFDVRREGVTPPTNLIDNERAWRFAQWAALAARGGPRGVAPSVLRELSIYGGAQGVWVDKARTGALTPDDVGVTVGVLHTGSSYADDLSASGLLYHYPQTRRPPGRDALEVAASKAAGRAKLPVFVISHQAGHANRRDVSLGWVEGWDDATKIFLITFDDQPPAEINVLVNDTVPFELVAAPQVASRIVDARLGQQRFKFQVFQRYGAACAVCNIAVKEVLDAAHIRSKKERGSDDPRNGLVLCAIHHRAYDAGYFSVEPNSLTVQFKNGGPDATALHMTQTSLNHLRQKPHPDALMWHWQRWQAMD